MGRLGQLPSFWVVGRSKKGSKGTYQNLSAGSRSEHQRSKWSKREGSAEEACKEVKRKRVVGKP